MWPTITADGAGVFVVFDSFVVLSMLTPDTFFHLLINKIKLSLAVQRWPGPCLFPPGCVKLATVRREVEGGRRGR